VSSAICCRVALMSWVGVVVIDCTVMGASPPTAIGPSLTLRVGRRGAMTGGGCLTDGIPRLTEVTPPLWTPTPAHGEQVRHLHRSCTPAVARGTPGRRAAEPGDTPPSAGRGHRSAEEPD